jgi:hypothetical protein
LIAAARNDVARQVNSTMTLLYWRVGQRIRRDIFKEKRAEYGQRIVSTVGNKLELEFGRGFSEKNLRRMIQFAEVFPDQEIVVALIRQLSWTHFLRLIPLDDPSSWNWRRAASAWRPIGPKCLRRNCCNGNCMRRFATLAKGWEIKNDCR